jgi:hypothetical protein
MPSWNFFSCLSIWILMAYMLLHSAQHVSLYFLATSTRQCQRMYITKHYCFLSYMTSIVGSQPTQIPWWPPPSLHHPPTPRRPWWTRRPQPPPRQRTRAARWRQAEPCRTHRRAGRRRPTAARRGAGPRWSHRSTPVPGTTAQTNASSGANAATAVTPSTQRRRAAASGAGGDRRGRGRPWPPLWGFIGTRHAWCRGIYRRVLLVWVEGIWRESRWPVVALCLVRSSLSCSANNTAHLLCSTSTCNMSKVTHPE